MSSLSIRGLPLSTKARLRLRAARHGRSMEAEARSILADALGEDRREEPDLHQQIRALFAPLGGVEISPPTRREDRDPPTFP